MLAQRHYQYFNYVQEEVKELPVEFNLYQNFPQTFYKMTRIGIDVPVRCHVKLTIYDTYGKEVKNLINSELLPGNYEVVWKIDCNQRPGVYYYKMLAGEFVDSKKVILLNN